GGTPQKNESEEQVQEKGLEVRANENVEQPAIKDSVQQETSSQNISSVQKPEKEAFEIDKVTFIETEKKEEENRKAETHIVKQGETLYGIARQYGIPLQDLADWNELKYDESIKIGQTILVNSPIKITSKDAPDVRNIQEKVQERVILHKVSSGETLYKIAREHNVTIKEVMEWNGKTDFNVALGEVIKIKKLIGNE
ncbi:MAG: LysM peptidoglycan-binding domain-containing protein, partial [Bacteroidota bacterium]|nr:LysM peptidoglycan-binding domain-containing protein [Bacteroidota bacterium]